MAQSLILSSMLSSMLSSTLSWCDKRCNSLLLVGIVSGVMAPALAQGLQDPTKPATSVSALSTTSEGEIAATGPVLQSVLIGTKRKIAVIDGQVIALHGKFGDQVLVQINESEVVLQRGKDMQVLKLFPDFEKKNSRKETRTKNKAGHKLAGES